MPSVRPLSEWRAAAFSGSLPYYAAPMERGRYVRSVRVADRSDRATRIGLHGGIFREPSMERLGRAEQFAKMQHVSQIARDPA
jgi:hypothetical protein